MLDKHKANSSSYILYNRLILWWGRVGIPENSLGPGISSPRPNPKYILDSFLGQTGELYGRQEEI